MMPEPQPACQALQEGVCVCAWQCRQVCVQCVRPPPWDAAGTAREEYVLVGVGHAAVPAMGGWAARGKGYKVEGHAKRHRRPTVGKVGMVGWAWSWGRAGKAGRGRLVGLWGRKV